MPYFLMTRSALLLLADSRFPAGAHAHSGGLESAAAAGRVHDTASLHEFLTGRLNSVALVAASFAAAACQCDDAATLETIDREYDVRLLSPALRLTSRRLGKQLLRTARATWPVPRLNVLSSLTDGPHQPLALGVVCAAAGLPAEDAALCSVHGALSAPANAAVRLLGLNPDEVAGVLARLAPLTDRIAAKGLTLARMAQLKNDFSMLPALGSPLLDLTAEDHATWKVRLFAS
jgi:urease accessory protein